MADTATSQVQHDAVGRRVVAGLSDQLDGPSEPGRRKCDPRCGPARDHDVVTKPADGSPDDDDHALRVRAAPFGMSVGPGSSAGPIGS